MLFGAETPFILLARIQVKPDKVQEYLLLAAKTDKAVEDSEPGMLHHTFDQDPENPLCFVWSEVYKNDEAFLSHLANPPVEEYLQGHADLAIISQSKFMELLEINVKPLWKQLDCH